METNIWIILTNRLGVDTRNPNQDTIETAIDDLRAHLDDIEHGSVSLRRGGEAGEMRVLELFSNGTMVYSYYEDQDFEKLLAEFRSSSLGVLDITRRFRYLLEGDVHALDLCIWVKTA